MKKEATPLQDCFILKPKVHKDQRGFFMETYNQATLEKALGFPVNFVQDNIAQSDYGVVRGLHFQKGEHAQAKLVSVVRGAVLDVVVDFRPDSSTYLQTFAVELNDTNHWQLYVPRGFAHGYAVLTDKTLFSYKCDNFYNKESEGGINLFDPKLNIDWNVERDAMLLSDKDASLPFLS